MKEMWTRLIGFFLCAAVSILGMSCSEEPPLAPAAPVRAVTTQPVAPPPEGEDQEPMEEEREVVEASIDYLPEGRRDPFKSVIVFSERTPTSEELPPLQRMDLSELKLIGVVWGGFGYHAMLRAADGKGYPIRVGTRVGSNNGVVRRISSTSVVVEERFMTIFGEKKTREVVMELRSEKESSE